jgi:hypothetical protein
MKASVVIPAFRSHDTLPLVLDALAPQIVSGDEVLVVESSDDGQVAATPDRRAWVKYLVQSQRTPQGRARNLGAASSTGDVIVFLDADAVPEPGWLDELKRHAAAGKPMVAGAILNAYPRHPVAVAAHLLDFNEWLPRRSGPLRHAASCNLLVERQAFLAAGGFPEDVWTAEDTLLSFDFARHNRLAWAPGARVVHLHRTHVRDLVLDQYKHGVGHATICERLDFPSAELVCERRLVLAFIHRLLGVSKRLVTQPVELIRACLVAPLVAVGLLAWLWGLARAPEHSFPSLPSPPRAGDRPPTPRDARPATACITGPD